jgi:hypothetical protein
MIEVRRNESLIPSDDEKNSSSAKWLDRFHQVSHRLYAKESSV